MQTPGGTARLHPVAAFVLSRQLPCALLLWCMLGGFVLLAGLLREIPLLGLLAMLAALTLNILAPALIALITFGGGITFALQVVLLASLGITALAGFAIVPGIWTFVDYGLATIVAAALFMRQDGLNKSASALAWIIGGSVALGLFIGAVGAQLSMQDYVARLLDPLFANMHLPTDGDETRLLLDRSQAMIAQVLPGLLAWGMWAAWWGNIVLARTMAQRYGFYQGATHRVLALRFGRPLAYAFLLALLLANFGAGDLRYVAVNAALLIGGLLAAQGIVVAHSWLKAREMQLLIGLMYLMLFIWSAMIIPFVIVGLLDIWFDFRRNNDPAHGGK